MKTEQLLPSALKAQKTIRITKATFHSYFQISGESSKQLSKVKASSQFADEERDSNWLG